MQCTLVALLVQLWMSGLTVSTVDERPYLFSEGRLAVGSSICELLEHVVSEGATGGGRPPASRGCQRRCPKQPTAQTG